MHRFAVCLALASLAGCSSPPPLVTGCEPEGPARPICGFHNPEDLVALPGDQALLVSEMVHDGGALVLFTLADEQRRVVFRGGDADGQQATWGDPACPGPPPPAFEPHGLHLSRRPDGALQLLAVQHGGRESVELFEVSGAGSDWGVVWRGCVEAPEDAVFNSVSALPEGGFLATKMISPGTGTFGMILALWFGRNTGEVYEWKPGQAMRALPGSEDSMPNGIEVSPDGRHYFVNTSGSGRVCRVERDSGQRDCVEISALDNARWAPDGRLLVASLLALGAREFRACQDLPPATACPMEFQIVAVDPDSLETEVLYRNAGPPMGAGTVGLQVGDELFIGSFAGDRILRVSLD